VALQITRRDDCFRTSQTVGFGAQSETPLVIGFRQAERSRGAKAKRRLAG